MSSKVSIVHFSRTPLAGAPVRLINALRSYTAYNVHLVDLKRWGLFDHDVVHSETPDRVFELAAKADIIHLHNYLDYNSNDFYPVDFKYLYKSGKIFLRQFHTHPESVAHVMGITAEELLASSIPSIVIAQFQERYYPHARVVPNIIPQDSPPYRPLIKDLEHHVFYGPSVSIRAWEHRWNTKGMPETLALLERVSRCTNCRVKWMSGQPLADVMREKRRSHLVIDELVTGSYHMSGLEGLSLGKPVLAFLDERTQYVLREISGSDLCPFINSRIEDGFDILLYLLRHPDEMAEIGASSREWIECYWADHILVQHFVDVYEAILLNPGLIVRQESLRLHNKATRFHALILPDLVYQSRSRCQDNNGVLDDAWTYAQRLIAGGRHMANNCLPSFLRKSLKNFWVHACRLVSKSKWLP
ncbi:hypothetical protein [uncultured Thiodictyon sp.]|jgi:hypothetical protein|uniref:glycosyltransferase n=1 Tax=uncultured Thiodictyon sp. TaxID=1846217 RepID=UPI0025FE2689|nr:hypothetical protein [uncultured Thiodictyon sp.]